MALKPRRVYLRITRVCNARCDYCPSWQMPKEFPPAERLVEIVDGIAAAGTREVRFTGGEPVLHPAFFRVVERSRSLGMAVSVITNGTLFHKKYREQALDVGFSHVLLSLDAPDAELHNRIRLVPSLYETGVSGVAALKQRSLAPRVEVNMVVSSDTVGRIADAVRAYAAAGVDVLNLIPIKDAPARSVSVDQMQRHNHAIPDLIALAREHHLAVHPHDFDLFGLDDTAMAASVGGLYPPRNACYVPFLEAFVDAVTGLVWPCDSTPYAERNCHTVGDLATASFDKIWAGPRFQTLRMAFRKAHPVPCSRKCDPSNAAHSAIYRDEVEAHLACGATTAAR